jgi:hypothetical protein
MAEQTQQFFAALKSRTFQIGRKATTHRAKVGLNLNYYFACLHSQSQNFPYSQTLLPIYALQA